MNKTASQGLIKKMGSKQEQANPLLFAKNFNSAISKCASKRNSKDLLLNKYSSCYHKNRKEEGMRKSCKN
jgi:hypothetical protein